MDVAQYVFKQVQVDYHFKYNTVIRPWYSS